MQELGLTKALGKRIECYIGDFTTPSQVVSGRTSGWDLVRTISCLLVARRPTRKPSVQPKWGMSVLLLWPERIEIRRLSQLSQISPRPHDAPYSFLVPPDRGAWVEEQVRRYPSPTRRASWRIDIRKLANERQRIQLELFGDGIHGVVYEATPTEIVPLYSRLSGSGFALIVMVVNFGLWGLLWGGAYLAWRFRSRRAGRS